MLTMWTMKPADYLNIAARYAIREDERNYHVGALATRRDGAVVLTRNGPLQLPDQRQPAHAEHRLCRKLDAGATVYVARLNAKGDWAMARPCPTCHARLYAKGVRRVYYTISPNEYGRICWA